MNRNREQKKENYNRLYLKVAAKVASNLAYTEDLVEVKEVDRKLSYSVVSPSSIICDVGGGTGVDAFPLAMLGALCICLDINKEKAKSGKVLSKLFGISSKLDFIVASATNMPFQNSALDLVTCFSVLDHLPNKNYVRLAVREFSRVIKPKGYVTITFPNTLFMIGTLSMSMKQLLDPDAFFEQRFTPQEMEKIIISSGLTPLASDSKYPTKLGAAVLQHNLPKIVSKIPLHMYKPVFLFSEKIFVKLEKRPWLKLFGARFGILSQKGPLMIDKVVRRVTQEGI
jgi:ubiquinone/menaquinone biosynthesis C-methylase UbiE